jgi:flagellar motor switch protein FliG
MQANSLRKAAIFLTTIRRSEAARLLAALDPEAIEAVAIEIARLGTVSSQEQEAVIRDFALVRPSSLTQKSSSLKTATSLLVKALGPKANSTIERINYSIKDRPFGFLHEVDAENLATFLSGEHPQTVAMVLSYLPPRFASEVLENLSEEKRLDVVERIAKMTRVSSDIVREVENALKDRIGASGDRHFQKTDGLAAAANILNRINRESERTILDAIAEKEPELAQEVRGRMFVFEDITRLLDWDIQAILKRVETSTLAMALKGTSDELKGRVLDNMSKRARDLLLEEIDYLGTVRMTRVHQAQQQIIEQIRDLEEAGEISLYAEMPQEQYIQ